MYSHVPSASSMSRRSDPAPYRTRRRWYIFPVLEKIWGILERYRGKQITSGNPWYNDAWWRMMIDDDSWWVIMSHDDAWWRMMTHHDSWWLVMIYDDSWWLMMIYDDSGWHMMIYDDSWWLMSTVSWLWWLQWLMLTADSGLMTVMTNASWLWWLMSNDFWGLMTNG